MPGIIKGRTFFFSFLENHTVLKQSDEETSTFLMHYFEPLLNALLNERYILCQVDTVHFKCLLIRQYHLPVMGI